MTIEPLPGGGRPWFLRVKKRWGCGLRPASLEGKLATGAYSAWVGLVTWFLLDGDPGTGAVIAWVSMLAAGTLLFILTALRMSGPAGPGKGRC